MWGAGADGGQGLEVTQALTGEQEGAGMQSSGCLEGAGGSFGVMEPG